MPKKPYVARGIACNAKGVVLRPRTGATYVAHVSPHLAPERSAGPTEEVAAAPNEWIVVKGKPTGGPLEAPRILLERP